MTADNKKSRINTDGLFRQNIVLMSGLVTAPIIVAATTMQRALVLSMAFFAISYVSVLICRFIPRKIVYMVRILLYTIVAAGVFVPTVIGLRCLFPETTGEVILYIELMVVNSLILAKTESRFYLEKYGKMAVDALIYIAGFAMAAFASGFVREIFSYGTVFGFHVCEPIVPAAKSPFFGFILVGIFAALCRVIVGRRAVRKKRPKEHERFRIEIDFDDEE